MSERYILSCESTVDLPFSYINSRDISVLFYTYMIDGKEFTDNMGRDEEALAALREGHVVVSLQQRGLFTNGGHYIILAKYQEDGKIKVLDPNKYNYVKSSIREDGFANGFEEKHITAGAKIYWIYEKKTLNDPACDRCGGEGADIFTRDYYCDDCRELLAFRKLFEQYCG